VSDSWQYPIWSKNSAETEVLKQFEVGYFTIVLDIANEPFHGQTTSKLGWNSRVCG
jgi:hypothetical protein